MERDTIDIFIELGRRLEAIANDIIERAVAENPWFTAAEIRLAAHNIASGMLRREALTDWLANYPALPVAEPKNVLIIMAGNIPFVGMQDLLCVLAAGHRAIVKPSSKDTVLMSWAVQQLLDIAPCLPVTLSENPPSTVIAMGGNETIAAIRKKYPGIPLLLRGHRSSAAVLDGSESQEQLAGLADDILTYSGLGCRNVSLIFVPQYYNFEKLQYALSERKNTLNIKYRNNCRQARAMLLMEGTPHIDCDSCLLVENQEFPTNISCINYTYYNTLYKVEDWITAHTEEIQCVATTLHSPLLTLNSSPVALGRTQSPALSDYPDGLDTMQFLMTI